MTLPELANFYDKPEFSDISLTIVRREDRTVRVRQTIKAHKIILSSWSQDFRDRFKANPEMKELEIPDVEVDVFRLFLKYLYTSDARIVQTANRAIPILQIARTFKVTGLVQICEDFLTQLLNAKNAAKNVLALFQQSINYKIKDWEDKIKTKICRYAIEILASDEFLKADDECVLKFLGEDSFAAKNEIEIFDAIIRWANAQGKEPKEHRLVLKRLIFLIRFPQMELSDFSQKVAQGWLLESDELYTMRFWYDIKPEERAKSECKYFNPKPRVYTEVPINIFIETPVPGVSFKFQVLPLDLVTSVKTKIEETEGIPTGKHYLSFENVPRYNERDKVLLDFNIRDGSVIKLNLHSSSDWLIGVKNTETGDIIVFMANAAFTTPNLQAALEKKIQIPPARQELSFNEKPLDPATALLSQQIKANDIIDLKILP